MTTFKRIHYFALVSAFTAAGCAKEKTTARDSVQNTGSDQGEACEAVEGLNFTTGGTPWANKNVTFSFMPDGTTTADGTLSDLFAELDANHARADWKRQFAIALSTWSSVSALNFREVSDSGAAANIAGPGQGDPRFGDIRVGMRNLNTSPGYSTYPGTTTGTGDFYLNTTRGADYKIGQHVDLASIALHEFGHTIGLGHSTSGTVMFGFLNGVTTTLAQDDITGIQTLYGPRVADSYDSSSPNENMASASAIASSASATLISGDLTTAEDVDFYEVTVPAGAGPVLSVTLIGGESLLQPTVSVYDGNGTLASEAAAADYGQGVLVQVPGAASGNVYFIQVHSPDNTPLGIGSYRFAVEYRATVDGQPYVPAPQIAADSYEVNDTFATSKSLGTTSSKTVSGLSIHTGSDQDYFHFTTASRASNYQVSLTYGAGSAPLEIQILNSNGTVRANSNGAASVSFSVSKSTTYKIRIFSPSSSARAYNLTVKKLN